MSSEENTNDFQMWYHPTSFQHYNRQGDVLTTRCYAYQDRSVYGGNTEVVCLSQKGTVRKADELEFPIHILDQLPGVLMDTKAVVESWTLQGQIKELEARLDLLKQQLKEKEV